MGAISTFPTSIKVRSGGIQSMFDDALRHHMAGRIGDAVARYKHALFLQPDYADGHNNLGVALAAQGRIDDAVARDRLALSLRPDNAAAHGNLGVALAAQGRIADAIAHYERALLLDPGHAGIHYNLGIALAAQGRIAEAVAHYRRAVALDPNYADAHNNLGNLLEAQDNSVEAMAHYGRAIAINPRHAEAHNNVGNVFRENGKFDDAMAHYGRAIAIAPANAEAHFHRAEIKTFHRGDTDLAVLEALAGRDDLPANKVPFVHFALAKALEDCGDYGRAFEHLRKGNTMKRRQIHYDEPAVARNFRRITGERLEGEGDPSSVPIFVLGMPRSGSTLIEQILASHPQIQGAGELPAVWDTGAPPDGSALRRMARSYIAGLPSLAEGKIRIVDKLPENFLRIGLIRLILPNARIIHTMRDPIDTCVSCYSKLFTSGQHFSYDLGELGRYYHRYRDLMTHWRSVLAPEAMLDVAYEDLVDDLEGQARRMIDYCGLPWDDRCLSFHRTIRPVKTASAVQVRQPLFRSSLQRWRNYEAGLGPLLKELEDLTAEDFHHVRAANAGQLGEEFAVGAHFCGHIQDYGEIASGFQS
jgi:tetratricopeptide (TPR) repeat protein